MAGNKFDFTEPNDVFTTTNEFKIDRSVYNELQFSRNFKKPFKDERIGARIRGFFLEVKCSRSTLAKFIFAVIPVLRWLPKYNLKKDLVRDMAGGLTVGIMQIPQGRSYIIYLDFRIFV